MTITNEELGIVALADVCEGVLGLALNTATRWHAKGLLPVPAFRMGNSKRGPLFIHKSDLEKLIAERRKTAVQTLKAMRDVGAV